MNLCYATHAKNGNTRIACNAEGGAIGLYSRDEMKPLLLLQNISDMQTQASLSTYSMGRAHMRGLRI